MKLNRRVTGLAETVQTALHQGSGQISIPNGILRDTDVFILLSPDGQVLASQGPIPASGSHPDRIRRAAGHPADKRMLQA